MAKAPTEIRSLARKFTESAMNTLAHIMREPTAPPAARVMAANALLDRGWGKAVQVAEVTMRNITAREIPDDELADIAVGSGTDTIDPAQLN